MFAASRLHPILAGVALLAGVSGAGAVRADTYSVSINSNMDLGQVIAGASGPTTFRIDPQSGQLNIVGGAGRRLSNALVRVTVAVNCRDDKDKPDGGDGDQGGGNNKIKCGKDKVRVVIAPAGAPTARALALTRFTVSMSSASLAGGVSVGPSTSFLLNPIGENQTKSFYLGADFPVAGDDAGLPSGTGSSPYVVYLTDESGGPLGQAAGVGLVTAYRSLAITKTADLRFGVVARPRSGSGTVTINPVSGARTVSGGVAEMPGEPFGPARFMITGEGGQAFSVSVPGNIQLSGPTNLNVQPTTNLPASPVLPGAVGAPGAFELRVGGSFPVANGSLIGVYSGNWTVTVDYN